MATTVSFLWHMHQPYYKDILTENYSMPWVRLHGIKAYYDMVSILEDFPTIKQTFNIVPSLILQLNDYAQKKAKDIFWDVSIKPTKDLTLDEKKFILWNFFMANWDTMIRPHERYWELLHKRGTKVTEEDIDYVLEKYIEKDYRDLQVWFNLAWFGFMARKNFPQINELISKGKNFTEGEKKLVLDMQIEVIKKIIPTYKKLQDIGQIEITTSPFYHPIMPLLYDTDIAKRNMPWVELPRRFNEPSDIEMQLEQAIELYKETFGTIPKGLWPSEGSVCPEIIPIIARQGIKWLATDEEILTNTIDIKDKGYGLYKPYRFCYDSSCIAVVFRDKGLSNAISFIYSKQDPQTAAQDLLRNLYNINEYAYKGIKEPLVTIILDGENPWEYYPAGGETFLRDLFKRLSESTDLQTATISSYLEKNPPQDELKNLYSGSWINHNFDIWIGDLEENTAWNYVNRTREFLVSEGQKGKVSKEKLKIAWQNLYAAEGSDWFWWYGDDFSTDCDEEFDEIFRMHLGNVYKTLGYPVPEYLKESILYMKEVQVTQPPIAFIDPTIDGLNTHFYEWSDSGYHDVTRHGGKLYRGESYLSRIYFGFNLETLFIRMDPLISSTELNGRDLRIYFNIIEPRMYQITFPLSFHPEKVKQFILNTSTDGINFPQVAEYSSINVKEIIEFSIPFNGLGFKPDETIHFFVQIKKDDTQLDRYPRRGYLSFKVPNEEFELDKWNV